MSLSILHVGRGIKLSPYSPPKIIALRDGNILQAEDPKLPSLPLFPLLREK